MVDLKGKSIAVIGDRDGIPGPPLKSASRRLAAPSSFLTTECFV